MRRTKMALVGAGTAVLVAAGGTATAGAAAPAGAGPLGGASAKSTSAEDAGAGAQAGKRKAWSCTKGAICFYSKKSGKGTRHQRFANTNKNITGIQSIRVNADTSERLDHVKIKWNWSGQSKSHWACGTPHQKDSGKRWKHKSATIDAVRWVKSC